MHQAAASRLQVMRSSLCRQLIRDMDKDDPDRTELLASEILTAIRDTALFYPCCGQDLDLPIQLFASIVSDFYFVDIRKPRRPDLHGVARLRSPARASGDADVLTHLASGQDFRLHRRQHRAEDFLHELPKLGVFFFRGDNHVDGEGSSGVLCYARTARLRGIGAGLRGPRERPSRGPGRSPGLG